jgi:hypothetical protein
MFELIILCLVIYIAAYFCVKASGQSMEVRPIKTFDDYFIESNDTDPFRL